MSPMKALLIVVSSAVIASAATLDPAQFVDTFIGTLNGGRTKHPAWPPLNAIKIELQMFLLALPYPSDRSRLSRTVTLTTIKGGM